MTSVARSLAGIAAALDERGRRWALVGGLAVSCHVDPRFTRDIDIAVVVADNADAESLVHALVSTGYTVLAALEQDAATRLATIRLLGPGKADVVIDLLFASSGIEAEACADAVNLAAFSAVVVPVATRAHLIAMKLLSVDDTRLQDAIDLRALLLAATPSDLREVESSIALIQQRGYHRGRDLAGLLQQYRGHAGG
jgi:hypothetical protein